MENQGIINTMDSDGIMVNRHYIGMSIVETIAFLQNQMQNRDVIRISEAESPRIQTVSKSFLVPTGDVRRG
jgi:hypothetical protein